MRFLLLAVAVWGLWIHNGLRGIKEILKDQEHWGRLTFLSLHLRNDADNLPPAMERLREDRRGESPKTQLEWLYLLVILVILGVVLNFGLFGDVGAGWFVKVFPPR